MNQLNKKKQVSLFPANNYLICKIKIENIRGNGIIYVLCLFHKNVFRIPEDYVKLKRSARQKLF